MGAQPIEPRLVVSRVEEYVDAELAQVEKYDHRRPLDESGIYGLHQLAAEIYALGYAEGAGAGADRAQAQRYRASTTEKTFALPDARSVHVVFDGPPDHESGRFVEVEDDEGASLRAGTWIDRKNGQWALNLQVLSTDDAEEAPRD